MSWRIELVKGRDEPEIQGWYSDRYGHKEPSTAAIYSADIDRPAVFAWLLIPARGRPPRAKASLIATKDTNTACIQIELPAEEPVKITIPLEDGVPTFESVGPGTVGC